MNRRDSIKTLTIGSLVGGGLLTAGCRTESLVEENIDQSGLTIGRTEFERERDLALLEETYFTPEEMSLIAVVCDIIIPADEKSGSATKAGVPDFIEFMAKDVPELQVKLRGGLAWLGFEAQSRFGKTFVVTEPKNQLAILDDIAYPDKNKDQFTAGKKFFSLFRYLTMTGFYTSREGLNDLEYQGNVANNWDGVPDEVLKQHGFELPKKYVDQYVNFDTRNEKAEWDDKGNLIT